MWFNITLCLVSVMATHFLAYYNPFGANTAIIILLSMLHGLSESLYAAHIIHDSSHAAITHNPGVWKFFGCLADLLIGFSIFSWNHQHVIGHHLYTNIRGADPDIGTRDVDFRRVSPSQSWRWVYRYQHIYTPVLYGLLSLKFRVMDWESFILHKNGRIPVQSASWFYIVNCIVGKIIFVVTRLIVPLYFFPAGHVLLVFFISNFTTGYYLSFIFEVSHLATGLQFYSTSIESNIPPRDIGEDWAIFQLLTTQDYAHGSKLTAFFTGGLNYQVTHHLFPSLSQGLLPEIAPIVKQTCDEFGVKYQILPNFWEALISHITYLKIMGQPPQQGAIHYTNNGSEKIKAA